MDNTAQDGLESEWGFAALIEIAQLKANLNTYSNTHLDSHSSANPNASGSTVILLDSGASPLFIQNAAALGIDLSRVNLAVLSHAHYDHANGFEAFWSNMRIGLNVLTRSR